jgi:hypothetical protein
MVDARPCHKSRGFGGYRNRPDRFGGSDHALLSLRRKDSRHGRRDEVFVRMCVLSGVGGQNKSFPPPSGSKNQNSKKGLLQLPLQRLWLIAGWKISREKGLRRVFGVLFHLFTNFRRNSEGGGGKIHPIKRLANWSEKWYSPQRRFPDRGLKHLLWCWLAFSGFSATKIPR